MALSTEEVMWGYRLVLNRDPESLQAIEWHQQSKDRATLLRNLIYSDEALSRPGAVVPIGLHMQVATNDVVLDATPAQREAMLERIGVAWRAYGESEPHWSVLTDTTYLSGTVAENLDGFYATGEAQVGLFLAALSRNGINKSEISRVLDFGCGVGRLTLALADHFSSVAGVDISPGHVSHATVRAELSGRGNASFHVISAVEDIDALGCFDLVFSEIVLQHNPPPVIAALLDRLFALLAPGGVARFQVPTYIAGFAFDPETYLAHEQPQMEMNAIPQKDVFAIAARHDCMPLEVREDGQTGDPRMLSHTFLFRRKG
jgi:SAM-dependent methyltransferase